MTCDALLDRASEYVDGLVEGAALAELEAHLDACEACRTLVADLDRVKREVGRIERVSPPAGTWTRITDRLQADPAFAMTSATSTARHPARAIGTGRSVAWLALAAALVLAIGGALVYVVRQPAGSPSVTGGNTANLPGSTNADAEDPVQAIEKELQLAATHYERAITNLEQVATASDSPLDPEVMAMLRKNLQVIDSAIDESRTALRTQPDSQLAQESLFDAFRRKVTLLQDTLALMNEMRKGNPEGAARVVEGLNKS
jgi:hypothetical protein